MMMSLNTRYVILLTLIFLGFAIVFAMAPTFVGFVTHEYDLPTTNCDNHTDYDDCVICCQGYINEVYGKELYGTSTWSEGYNSCWDKYCQKYSK